MLYSTLNIANKILFPTTLFKWVYAGFILLLLILGDIFVSLMGGTHLAYLHIMYIPILLAGLIFSIHGGVIAGILAGLLLGPCMLEYTDTHICQPLASWSLRLGIFAFVGAISGVGSSIFRAYLQELENKRTTNSVTSLPNLNGLSNIFNDYVNAGTKPISIIVIDLFQMGRIDRALGSAGTEHLICKVAQNLVEELGDLCTVGHLHSKRFTLIVPNKANLQSVLEKCDKVANRNYHFENIPIFIEMHFGISCYPADAKDLPTLAQKGRIAIDSAKRNSLRFGYFEGDTTSNAERNLLLLHQLDRAIENKSLEIHFQPQICFKTGNVLGLESLARWTDPILGTVSPQDFIPLTEETTLINPFTKLLIEQTIKKTEEIHQAGHKVHVAMNFSTKNFNDRSVIESLYQSLENHSIDSKYLEIEITESAVATNLQTIIETLMELRKHGLRIAIDDFGTGQSSQHYLFELPVDVIKIDKLFIQKISKSNAASAIVSSNIALGHELGLQVIAEGVETSEQVGLLKKWGCDIGQGFYFSQPISSDAIIDWLDSCKQK